jgi:hypothetical protein
MPQETSDVFASVVNSVKGMFADMMQAAGRPSVVQSESGVSSVKLNQLANGSTQVEVKIYHADPYEAACVARTIYESEIKYWNDHAPAKK